jgi:hypothetical protein
MRQLAHLVAAAAGTAALAAMVLVPTAANATTSTSAAHPTAITRLAAPTAVSSPDIVRRACTSSTDHYVKVYGLDNNNFCLGFKGTYHPDAWEAAVCAGNNYGYFNGWTETHVFLHIPFKQGNVDIFAGMFPGGEFDVTNVTIQGYGGNDTCPGG